MSRAYLHPSSPAAAGCELGAPATALDFRPSSPPANTEFGSHTRS